MKLNTKNVSAILVVFTAALILYLFFYVHKSAGNNNTYGNSKEANINYEKLNDIVFEVKVAEALKGDLEKYIEANGIAKAYNELAVIGNISGYIDQLSVYEGKRVKEDDVLLILDEREMRLMLKEAESKLEEAKIQYVIQKREMGNDNLNVNGQKLKNEISRIESEYKKGNIKENDYLKQKELLETELILSGAEKEKLIENKSGLTTARNSFEHAQLSLNYTRIVAPFCGAIADFNLTRGQRINAGDKLFKLLDVSRIKIDVGVLENDIPFVKLSEKAEVKFPSLPEEAFYGKVIYINPSINAETKTCRVTIEIGNNTGSVKPGMYASVKLNSHILKDRTIIPREALLVRDRKELVFIKEGEFAQWRYVETGQQNDKFVEIIKGIDPGDKVIVDGHYNLAHGSKIKVAGK
ncbi:MAG TPA: efflux RND transporter periplasmic adaptor subunit [Ignavibacteriales bacterium]|nr:efflux RND transporter periplasmic adaptor subunit [Ignavibacteriales bacterium]